MSTAELPRPGVEVIQVFQSVTPTVITPTLVPTVLGVCRQVVDVLTTTATGGQTINSEALVPLPAFFLAKAATGSPPVYAGLDGLKLVVSLNNGPNLEIDFVGSPLSPSQIVATVLEAFSDNNITGFTAELVGTTQWRLRSLATDQFQSIFVDKSTSGAVLAAFGIGPGKLYVGEPTYAQDALLIPEINLPDPNHNIAQLEVDTDTERAFLFFGGTTGSALMEVLRTQSFLSNGIALAAILHGSVDLTTITLATEATFSGTADITNAGLYGGGGSLNGETIILNVDGAGLTTLNLVGTGNAASEAALLAAIQTQWPTITAVQGGSGGNKLVLTSRTPSTGTLTIGSGTANTNLGLSAGAHTGSAGTLDGQTLVLAFNGGSNLTTTFVPSITLQGYIDQINGVIGQVAFASEDSGAPHHLSIATLLLSALATASVVSGSAAATLGLSVSTVTGTAAVTAIDSGNGTALTTLLSFPGQNFTTSPGSGQVTGTNAITSVTDGHTLIVDDGYNGPQTVSFLSASSSGAILSQINALLGAAAGGKILATIDGSTHLVLTNTLLGQESIVKVVGGTALAELFLTAGVTSRGQAFVPAPGDVLYVDGNQYATIVQVAPGGNTSQLKINKSVPISSNVGSAYYIIAANLNIESATIGVTRPTPNLVVDGVGNLQLKPDLIRNSQGTAIASPAQAQMYVAYKAVRLDVTALAMNPGLLRFSDIPTLESQLAPLDADNPLGLGLWFALQNSPGVQVTGLGIDQTSGNEPFGTVDAFTRAATFLEGYEVYGIAPMTHEDAVFQILATHVTFMSAPENKGERIVLINEPVPTNKLDGLVASGTDGNTNTTSNQFDTGVANLGQLLMAHNLSGVGPYITSAGIYLDVGDGNKYNVINVVGSVVSLKTSGFLPGENDDAYYATTTLPTPLIDQAFAVRIRGAALVLVDGTPDKDGKALAVQQTSQGFANRRVWSVFPDQCAATINGIEQILDGFYMSAAIVGMIANQPPQQSFTNFPMTGFTRVIGSNDTFSNPQLNVMAAGGTYIIVQDAPSTPLISRMALTTDMSSIETRTDSITKIVDFTAKFLRSGLRNFIGRFNITQGFLDSLGHVIQGLLGFLTESGVLIGAQLNNIIQDTSAPDTVLVDVVLDVPFPCNYIRLTLTI